MLVCISDLHLRDESVLTIPANMTNRFLRKSLIPQIRDALAKEVEVLFLGDIVDVNRSRYWVNGRSHGYRPWSHWYETQEKLDGHTPKSRPGFVSAMFEADILNILNDIEEANRESLAIWRAFKDFSSDIWGSDGYRPDKIRFLFIPGNHDRLVQYSETTRKRLCEILYLDNYVPNQPYPWWLAMPEYSVLAQHGQIFDTNNSGAKGKVIEGMERQELQFYPSLGDVFTVTFGVELVERFEHEVRNLPSDEREGLVNSLAKIDLVRPQVAALRWLHDWGLQRATGYSEALDKVISDLVREFLHIDFVDRWLNLPSGVRFILRMGIGLPKNMRKAIEEMDRHSRAPRKPEKYMKRALKGIVGGPFAEWHRERCPELRHIVSGHTHIPIVVPLTGTTGDDSKTEYMHFNTGTWLDVIEEGKGQHGGFAKRHQMSHVMFYKDGEDIRPSGKERSLWEFWGGSLREGGM